MSNSRDELSQTATRKALKDADDLEAAALRLGMEVQVPLEESIYDQGISEEEAEAVALDEEEYEARTDIDAVEESVKNDVDSEDFIAAAGLIIQERQQVLGDNYPFQLEGNLARYVGSRTLVYEFCLAASYVNVSVNPYRVLQVAFERLSGIVFSILLGPDTLFLRTGYPFQPEDVEGEPNSFADTVARLSEAMPGEWELNPGADLESVKDGGVDVIAWKRPDLRANSLIFAGNCGCGSNWLERNKHRERPSGKLLDYLIRPREYHIRDFFSLPFHVKGRRDWKEACDEGRFFLDRLRLTSIAASVEPDDWDERSQRLGYAVHRLIRIADPEFQPEIMRKVKKG